MSPLLAQSGHRATEFQCPLSGVKRTSLEHTLMSASLIGPVGVKRFQAIRHCGVDVARGLVLLSGLGARALPSWDPRTRWNNLLSGLSVKRTIGPSRHANSPHPSSREGTLFHRLVELEFPPIAFDAKRPLGRSSFSGPSEFSAINPDAMHNHG